MLSTQVGSKLAQRLGDTRRIEKLMSLIMERYNATIADNWRGYTISLRLACDF